MTCDFRDTSNALSMQMRGKFIEKDLRAFSLSSAKRYNFNKRRWRRRREEGPPGREDARAKAGRQTVQGVFNAG